MQFVSGYFMETLLKSTLLFLIICNLICCKPQTNGSSVETNYDDFIDTLRANTNKVIISFYVDYYNSEIRITNNAIIEKNKLDYIFLFIESNKVDSCNLNSSLKPDGLISFYKNDSLVDDFAFVLFDTCNGLYSDFTSKPKKYTLSKSGQQNLTYLKKQMFAALKNNR